MTIRRGTQSTIIVIFGVIGIISCFLPWIAQSREWVLFHHVIDNDQGSTKSAISLSGTPGGYIYIAFLAVMILCVLVGIFYGCTGSHAGDAVLKILGLGGMAGTIGSAWDLSGQTTSGSREIMFRQVASMLKFGFWLALVASVIIIITALIPVEKEQGY